MILFLTLIMLAAGFFAGWRVCMTRKDNKLIEENIFLRNQAEQLKENVKYYYDQSQNNRQIHNDTIVNHNHNLKNTLENIVTLLQHQQKETLKEGEKDNIESIIKTIKSGL